MLLHILILLLVAVAVTRSMWEAPALVAGHSASLDLARLVEFDAAVRAGDLFPTWSPDLYTGYGSPIFQFYAPLTYYFAEVPVLIGFDYAAALKEWSAAAAAGDSEASYRLGLLCARGHGCIANLADAGVRYHEREQDSSHEVCSMHLADILPLEATFLLCREIDIVAVQLEHFGKSTF